MDKSKYQYIEEVFADVSLIWTNCKTYNVSGSEIYRMAENMERKGKKAVRDLKIHLKLEQPASTNQLSKTLDGLDSSDDDDMDLSSKKKSSGINGGSKSH